MGRTETISALTLLLALAGCASGRDRAPSTDWRAIASPGDRERLRSWRETWTAAIRKAQPRNRARIDAAGALLRPDASLGLPMPQPGSYICRVVRVGALVPGTGDLVSERPAACRIEPRGAVLGISKVEGAQQPAGWLYPDAPDGGGGPARMIFLGSMRLADERRPLPYGSDPERDMAGILERIGPDRWRLALPRPRWDAMLTVVEIVPAPE